LRIALSLALAVAIACVAAYGQFRESQRRPDMRYTGALETFLNNTKSPHLDTKLVGSLAGDEKATIAFKAVVAWDPSRPETKLRALAVDIEVKNCKEVVYADVDLADPRGDPLKEFLNELDLIQDKNEVAAYWRRKGATNAGTTVGLLDPVPHWARVGEHSPLAVTVLNIGWWRKKDDIVLIVQSPVCGATYLPNASLTQVMSFVASARKFLASN